MSLEAIKDNPCARLDTYEAGLRRLAESLSVPFGATDDDGHRSYLHEAGRLAEQIDEINLMLADYVPERIEFDACDACLAPSEGRSPDAQAELQNREAARLVACADAVHLKHALIDEWFDAQMSEQS